MTLQYRNLFYNIVSRSLLFNHLRQKNSIQTARPRSRRQSNLRHLDQDNSISRQCDQKCRSAKRTRKFFEETVPGTNLIKHFCLKYHQLNWSTFYYNFTLGSGLM